jgi:hypothetical protein
MYFTHRRTPARINAYCWALKDFWDKHYELGRSHAGTKAANLTVAHAKNEARHAGFSNRELQIVRINWLGDCLFCRARGIKSI